MSPSEPKNRKALETGSGIGWDEWLELLAPHRDLDHTEMAKVALAEIQKAGRASSPEWWAQGVTVAYEQHIGRRKVGQQCDGSFSATISKTVTGGMDEVAERWAGFMASRTELDGVPVEGEPRRSSSEKWRYWRVNLADGTLVSVNMQAKPGGEKTAMAVNHDKLTDAADPDRWRAYWRALLTAFAAAS